jgi:hypothetical protein
VSSPEVRASDADRERVAARLRDHLAAGRLTLDELSERLDAAYAARTVGELEELTNDLPAAGAPPPAPPPRAATRWSVAVMGSVERKRRWRVPDESTAVAFMGSVELDLRQAEIASSEVEITAVAIMGSVEVVVPPGVDVELSGVAIMGSREERVADVPLLPGAPRIHVRAFALMGSVEVRSKPRAAPRHPGLHPPQAPWTHSRREEA